MSSDKALAVVREPKALTMFEMKPQQMIAYATEIANVLKAIVSEQKLYTNMGKKDHVWVEGWTTMGAMIGIVPREEWVKKLDDGSYEAKVELISLATGKVVGGGSALCSVQEKNWRGKDEFSIRSMAITRATGKAYRLGYSWIMTLSGYSPTPAEEMPDFQGYTHQETHIPSTIQPQTMAQKVREAPPTMEAVVTNSYPFQIDPLKYRLTFSKAYKGKSLSEIGVDKAEGFAQWLRDDCKKKGQQMSRDAQEFIANLEAFKELSPEQQAMGDIPF